MSNFRLTLIKPQSTTRNFLLAAWKAAMVDVEGWMKSQLVPAMVNGGLGIKGIAQTPFYKFVTSPEGLSQLGVEASEPPKLLRAYDKAFKTRASAKSIMFQFGDESALKAATRHPATGTGKLKVESWLDWVIDGEVVTDAGFIPRNEIPMTMRGNIRLGAPLGGLMLGRGAFGTKSTGSWTFPKALQRFDEDWFISNISNIEQAIVNQVINIFKKKLNG